MAETITGVALLGNDGKMIALPRPARHPHLFSLAAFIGSDFNLDGHTEGFITSKGRFVDRVEAFRIVKATNERFRNVTRKQLYSEDLW